MRLIAITREVSPAIGSCELTHLERAPIDLALARQQHAAYEEALRALGCAVHRLTTSPEMPDSVFVEDIAVVLDEIAIVTRPGAESRRAEIPAVSDALSHYRPLLHIESPGTLDGGDVMVVGRQVFVGETARTNRQGIEQLRHLVAPHGYSVSPVTVSGCLHLKSAVTALDDQTLLMNPLWAQASSFRGFRIVEVSEDEPSAANVLRVGERLIYASAFPRTLDHLRHRGYDVTVVDNGELSKAEGAVTCGSLIFSRRVAW